MGNLKLSNLKQIKTTILGLIFITSGILYIFKIEEINFAVFGVLIGIGLFLLLSPDDIVIVLKDTIKALRTIYIDKNSKT